MTHLSDEDEALLKDAAIKFASALENIGVCGDTELCVTEIGDITVTASVSNRNKVAMTIVDDWNDTRVRYVEND